MRADILERLNQYLHAKKLSVSKAAHIMRVDEKTLGYVCDGVVEPNRILLRKIEQLISGKNIT